MIKKSLLTIGVALLFAVAGVQGQRGGGQAAQLADGPGKDAVQTTCSQCHALNLVTNAGYSRQDWDQVIGAMTKLSKDETKVIGDYLGKNYPEKPKTPAVIVPGSVKVSIKEWLVPSPGSRPHD